MSKAMALPAGFDAREPFVAGRGLALRCQLHVITGILAAYGRQMGES